MKVYTVMEKVIILLQNSKQKLLLNNISFGQILNFDRSYFWTKLWRNTIFKYYEQRFFLIINIILKLFTCDRFNRPFWSWYRYEFMYKYSIETVNFFRIFFLSKIINIFCINLSPLTLLNVRFELNNWTIIIILQSIIVSTSWATIYVYDSAIDQIKISGYALFIWWIYY